MARAIVAEFYREANRETRLFGLTVIEEETSHNGGVYLARWYYDVEWCRTLGLYIFDQSGGGGCGTVDISGLYFVSGEVSINPGPTQWCGHRSKRSGPYSTKEIRKRNRTRRLQSLPREIELRPDEDLLGWLQRNAIQESAIFCATCRDWLPQDDCNLCDHIWWCDKLMWYSTPTERCKCKDREECCA